MKQNQKVYDLQLKLYPGTFENLEYQIKRAKQTRENFEKCKSECNVGEQKNNNKDIISELIIKRKQIKEKKDKIEYLKSTNPNKQSCTESISKSNRFREKFMGQTERQRPAKIEISQSDNKSQEIKASYEFYKHMHSFRVRCQLQELYAIVFNTRIKDITSKQNVVNPTQKFFDDNVEMFNVAITNLVILVSNAAKVLSIDQNCKYVPMGSLCYLIIKNSQKSANAVHYDKRSDIKNERYVLGLLCNDFSKILAKIKDNKKQYYPMVDHLDQEGQKSELRQILFVDKL